jgi:hypothetical protein
MNKKYLQTKFTHFLINCLCVDFKNLNKSVELTTHATATAYEDAACYMTIETAEMGSRSENKLTWRKT